MLHGMSWSVCWNKFLLLLHCRVPCPLMVRACWPPACTTSAPAPVRPASWPAPTSTSCSRRQCCPGDFNKLTYEYDYFVLVIWPV